MTTAAGMSRRRVVTAWCLGGLGVSCVLAATGFFAAGGYRIAALYGNEIGIALGFTVVGAVVSARTAGNALTWLMLVTGVVHASGLLALEWLSWLGKGAGGMPTAVVTYAEISWLPGFVTLFTLVPLLFPTGRPLTSRWRVLVWTSAVGMAVSCFSVVVGTRTWTDFGMANAAYHPQLANVIVFGGPLTVLSVVGSIASLVVRYRRSAGVQRQQMRWFVWSYVLVTGLLVATYVGGVALLTRLGPFSSSVGVATTTLVVAAAFNPLRRRVQGVVDQRFNRQRYDATRTIDAFAVRLRDEVDPDVVRGDLLGVATRAIQPASLSLWVAT